MESLSPTRDADATRERILDAAFERFVAHGFAGASMREIAQAAGVTKSLIHHHFGTKRALWDEVKNRALQHYTGQQMQLLETAAEADRALLGEAVRTFFAYLRDHPRVVRLLAWTHIEGDRRIGRLDAELIRLGSERIRAAQQAGRIRDDLNPVHIVCTFVHACTHWFVAASHHADWPGVGSDEEFLEDFLKIFLDGLLPAARSG
ncbi:MAG: TetR family transcriptional regulator [Wenzhouxiangellaceae bacterium]